MNEYRVTKYNLAFRDSSGAYTRDEWISFGDIGRSFDGVKLTAEAYARRRCIHRIGGRFPARKCGSTPCRARNGEQTTDCRPD